MTSVSVYLCMLCAFALAFAVEGHAASLSTPASQFKIQPFAFFKNSKRRDATEEEAAHVVKLGSGCTGFFVKNTQGRNLIMTARHCVSMSITNWCNGGGTFVDTDKEKGTCSKIIAADVNHDIALFEGKLPYQASEDQSLSLAAYDAEVGQRLVMVGYPADKFRVAKLTTTENCWITKKDVPSPHSSTMADRSALHNCTTYGGNSGGPMIAQGTQIALGLPFTYYPGNYTEFDEVNTGNHARMAKMSDFVSVHSKALKDAGVVMVEANPAKSAPPPPVKPN